VNKKLLLFFLLISVLSFAQDENSILPMSLQYNLRSTVTPIELPPLYLDDIIAEDEINDLDKSLPWRYGISRPLVLDLDTDGEWTELDNNRGRIWQVAIWSPDAVNLSINFNDFKLPDGAMLHLYNDERTDFSKTYTKKSKQRK
jgi:hypothetical protein